MSKKPKILFADIETSPVRANIFRTGKQVISHSQIAKGDSFGIICIAWKWLGEKTVHCVDWGVQAQNTEKVVKAFGKVVEEADIVIGHNWDKFDKRQINAQRMITGLEPINWPASEDTLKAMRKHFYLTSFKLDYVAKLLFEEGKTPMTLTDWEEIKYYKNKKALDKMVKYCKKDVILLEKVWKKIQNHIEPKVHRGLLINGDRDACSNCGSKSVQKYGFYITKAGKYQKYRCNDCAATFRDTRQVKDGK